MVRFTVGLFAAVLLFGASCNSFKNTGKYSFADGYYKSTVFQHTSHKVYVDNNDDSILVYPLDKHDSVITGGPSGKVHLSYPQNYSVMPIVAHNFRRRSMDFDFLTIPFKYRPPVGSFPNQFNTDLSGALYLGYRNDIYHLTYKRTPLKKYQKQLTRYGFSLGCFSGIGGTAMNPWVTNNAIASEYNGVVWMKGVSAVFNLDGIGLGFCFGWDNLLDANHSVWIYQHKPWLGLAFGIRIN